ncbi:MAG: SIMPL domain-containing protein [Armatimonadota bacterium]
MIVSLAIFALLSSRPCSAQTSELQLLTAVGEAEVRVSPDLAEVSLGVEAEAATAEAAREQAAVTATRIIDAIKRLGIPESAIRTSTFQIFPIRRFPSPDQQTGEPPVVGYQVTNIVSVRTENLAMVSRIIDRGVQAGANRVEGVNFMLRDESAAQTEALSRAIANARANAQTMASSLGVELVRVQTVQQGGLGIVTPSPIFRGAALEAATRTPIFPGEVTVSAVVTLTYVIR